MVFLIIERTRIQWNGEINKEGSMSQKFASSNVHEGFEVKVLFETINNAVSEAKRKLISIRDKKDQFSIAEMFEMQMLMNNLSQLSEMSTAVVSASNTALLSMARGVKQ
jgi:hypothetical protein